MSDTILFLQAVGLLIFVIVGVVLIGQMTKRMERDYDALEPHELDWEIARKVAIADAAIEARRRGEDFTPPADYDR